MATISLVQVARYVVAGTKTLAQLDAEGLLTAENVWLAAKGAERFAQAVARGDVADADVQAERGATCGECPSRTECAGFGYCGPALVERLGPEVADPTCGCLVEGAAAVKSHRCPQCKWVR